MSIAAISQSFVSAVRAGTAPAAVEATEPVRAAGRVTPREPHGRRQALVEAIYESMDVDAAAEDRKQTQAVYRFAHALMHDLREMDGDQPTDGSGRALGRRDWGDLGQRLSALATAAASKPDADPAPAVPEMPQEPRPVTTATAAVHLMQVPSARLLEAFVAMHRALERQDEERNPIDLPDARGALAQVLRTLAQAASAETPIDTQAGALLDIRA